MALLAPMVASAQKIVDSEGRLVVDLDEARRQLVLDSTYKELKNPVPGKNPKVIEVLNFFSWHCGACYRLHARIAAWAKSQPADVRFTRLPVSWGKSNWNAQARAWYALEQMGALQRVEPDILKGIHEQKLRLDSELELAGWITDHGMDARRFLELARSEQIVAKADEVDKLARACRVESVPWVVVDGRFVPIMDMSFDAALIVTGKLVDLVRDERSGKKAS